jgi:DNA-directed RNA polymerase specialized sigma24 family protein
MKQPSPNFYSIFNEYHDRLKKFVTITVKNEWVVDDIVQEAFVRAQTKIDALKDHDKIGVYKIRCCSFRKITERLFGCSMF